MPRKQIAPEVLAGTNRGGEIIEPGGFDFLTDTAERALIQRRAHRLHRRFGLSLIAGSVFAADALRASRAVYS